MKMSSDMTGGAMPEGIRKGDLDDDERTVKLHPANPYDARAIAGGDNRELQRAMNAAAHGMYAASNYARDAVGAALEILLRRGRAAYRRSDHASLDVVAGRAAEIEAAMRLARVEAGW